MIGQRTLLKQIDQVVQKGFPRFSILVGAPGSGRKLLVARIAKKLDAFLVSGGIKVDEIREVIALAYKQTEPVLYMIPNSQDLSLAAKNSLLKITEEPPQKAYFTLTLDSLHNTLPTLKSRATVFNMQLYTEAELIEYMKLKGYSLENKQIIINVCGVPGKIDLLQSYDVKAFDNFVRMVVNNIGVVNGVNAFKIGNKLQCKKEQDGWDIELFLRYIIYIYSQKMHQDPLPQYWHSIKVTSKYISELRIKGINKASLIDMWILEMRGINREE